MKAAIAAWFLAIVTLVISVPNVFGSRETLARNSKLIGTENLVVVRIVCVVGVLAGVTMLFVAVGFTYHEANAVFSAGGLVAALVIVFFTCRRAKADAAKSQKAGESDSTKP